MHTRALFDPASCVLTSGTSLSRAQRGALKKGRAKCVSFVLDASQVAAREARLKLKQEVEMAEDA
jgi:hypothetical protein